MAGTIGYLSAHADLELRTGTMSDSSQWVQVKFPDGKPHGVRIAERRAGFARVTGFPRVLFPDLKNDAVLSERSVYVLRGPDPDGDPRQRVYVGKTGNPAKKRLGYHLGKKEFWIEGAVITSRLPDGEPVPIDALESLLIERLFASGWAVPDNDRSEKAPSQAPIEEEAAAAFAGDALLCLRALGFPEFDINTPGWHYHSIPQELRDNRQTEDGMIAGTDDDFPHTVTGMAEEPADYMAVGFQLDVGKTHLHGLDVEEGFVVRSGSVTRCKTAPSFQGSFEKYAKRRLDLIESGALIKDGDIFHLTRDEIFRGPGAAVTVLYGAGGLGKKNWIGPGGMTYAEWETRNRPT